MDVALAIALVTLVDALAGRVTNAQASALQSVHGDGTDHTVAETTTGPSAGAVGRLADETDLVHA